MTVTVTCVDDPPVAVERHGDRAEDAAATAIAVLANDTDPDGGPITITSVTQPANGTVVITAAARPDLPAQRELLQQPAGHDAGHVHLHPDAGRLDGDGDGDGHLRRRQPPVAVDDTATVAEDAGATAIDVLANDTDADGGPIDDRAR